MSTEISKLWAAIFPPFKREYTEISLFLLKNIEREKKSSYLLVFPETL